MSSNPATSSTESLSIRKVRGLALQAQNHHKQFPNYGEFKAYWESEERERPLPFAINFDAYESLRIQYREAFRQFRTDLIFEYGYTQLVHGLISNLYPYDFHLLFSKEEHEADTSTHSETMNLDGIEKMLRTEPPEFNQGIIQKLKSAIESVQATTEMLVSTRKGWKKSPSGQSYPDFQFLEIETWIWPTDKDDPQFFLRPKGLTFQEGHFTAAEIREWADFQTGAVLHPAFRR